MGVKRSNSLETLARAAVARKLTLMSEMNPYFVADARLWRWIEGALREDDFA